MELIQSVALAPLHTVVLVGFTLTEGFAFTVTVTVFVFVQPAELVPVTVYVVVVVGLAVTVAPVVEFNPEEGAHAYVFAPLAVRFVPLPEQIVADEGVTVIEGIAFIVAVTEVLVELSQVVEVLYFDT